MSTVHNIPIKAGAHHDRPHTREDGLFGLPINIVPVERFGRIAIGLAAVITGGFLLLAAASLLAMVLEVLLILAGLDLAVTGALGHCPLYFKLGYVPKPLRSVS